MSRQADPRPTAGARPSGAGTPGPGTLALLVALVVLPLAAALAYGVTQRDADRRAAAAGESSRAALAAAAAVDQQALRTLVAAAPLAASPAIDLEDWAAFGEAARAAAPALGAHSVVLLRGAEALADTGGSAATGPAVDLPVLRDGAGDYVLRLRLAPEALLKAVQSVVPPASGVLRLLDDGGRIVAGAPAADAAPPPIAAAAAPSVVRGLRAVAEVPEGAFAAPLRADASAAAAIAGAVLLAGLAAAFVLGRRARRPVEALAAAVALERGRREPLEGRVEAAEATGSIGFFDFDFARNASRWSRGMSTLLGVPHLDGDRAWTEWTDLIEPEYVGEANAAMARCLEARTTQFDQDVCVRRPDGSVRWLATHARIRYNPDGEPERMAGVMIDATGRRLAEGALEAARRDKEAFLAGLARELRGPLAPIRNSLALLHAKEVSGEDVAWAAEIIERHVKQLVGMIDNLLDLSHIAAQRLTLRRQPTRLRDLVAEAAEAARGSLQARGVRLCADAVGEDTAVHVDPVRMRKVLAILIEHAARRCRAGTDVRVVVRAAGGAARIAVIDTGIPLRPDELTGVFELFYRGADRPDAVFEPGLALARELARLNGGTLHAENEAGGHGVRLEIALPVEAAAGPRAPAEEARRPRRVLVADDSRDTADSSARILRNAGHDVAVAYDGTEAVAVARTFRPEFVLLDISMPQMDGYAAAREIREACPGGAPVLIAVTGWGERADRARAMAAGFDHHFAKPVDPQRVLQLIA